MKDSDRNLISLKRRPDFSLSARAHLQEELEECRIHCLRTVTEGRRFCDAR
jgi:hypothetical protein